MRKRKKVGDKLYEGYYTTSTNELDKIHELMFTYKAKSPVELREELIEQANTYETV